LTLPGDKSLSHRAAIFAALAEGHSAISNFSTAADCASTLGCLAALGVPIDRTGSTVRIGGRGFAGLRKPAGPLDAGNSGSTLRMLAGVLAGRPFRATLTGDESLCRRPVERVAEPLRAMGAVCTSTEGRAPLTIEGTRLRPLRYAMPMASAQVKTAVLLAGLQADGRTSLVEPSPSRDHTERLLPAFGVSIAREGATVSVDGPADLRAIDFAVPGDVSSAAFFVVAALVLPHSDVRIDDVLLNPQRTAFLDVLKAMGGDVEWGTTSEQPEPVGWVAARSSRMHGTVVTHEIVPALIDEVPALCVAAACAEGSFSISGASELRVKESDRIAALVEGLGRMGAQAHERPAGLEIDGGPRLRGAAVEAHGDHRIAMALAIAALTADGDTQIAGAECAAVSFPEFFELLGAACRG
jgi:3-phosphoshikimate 1-carboxyvinyltransferase